MVLLNIINTFNGVARYKINTKKSIVFVHTSNKKWNIEIRKTIPLATVPKIMTFLTLNFTKNIQD